MYTTEQVWKAYSKLSQSEKRSVTGLVREYRDAIDNGERSFYDAEMRRYYAGQATVLHDQICTILGLQHNLSMRHTILEAIK